MNKKITDIALRAYSEGRLWWRVSDHLGYSCNGGDHKFRPDPPTRSRPGNWAPKLEGKEICKGGVYHVTSDPLRWAGSRVALVEIDQIIAQDGSKACCRSLRELAVVDPDQCVDVRIWVACKRPYLTGASLDHANLSRANLSRARLTQANLTGASLSHAKLDHANLSRASLDHAKLDHANFDYANLIGATLTDASLNHASLDYASLDHANFNHATFI